MAIQYKVVNPEIIYAQITLNGLNRVYYAPPLFISLSVYSNKKDAISLGRNEESQVKVGGTTGNGRVVIF